MKTTLEKTTRTSVLTSQPTNDEVDALIPEIIAQRQMFLTTAQLHSLTRLAWQLDKPINELVGEILDMGIQEGDSCLADGIKTPFFPSLVDDFGCTPEMDEMSFEEIAALQRDGMFAQQVLRNLSMADAGVA